MEVPQKAKNKTTILPVILLLGIYPEKTITLMHQNHVVGGGFKMGNTRTPMADSSQCMAKPKQCCKVK